MLTWFNITMGRVPFHPEPNPEFVSGSAIPGLEDTGAPFLDFRPDFLIDFFCK